MKSSASTIVIRPMRRRDVPVAVGMLHALSGKKKLKADFLARHSFGKDKSNHAVVALADGKIIGLAMASDWANLNLNHIDSTLNFLFVAEGWRGQGIGRSLAVQVARDASKRGCVWFRTSTSPHNQEAQRLYSRLGFAKRDYQPFLYLLEGKALRNFIK